MQPGNWKPLRKRLLQWYDEAKRDLPWRKTQDPYRIWVAEVMLQQTQVKTVLKYYDRFLQAFPTLKAFADASLEDVLRVWQGLGYYARARNLHRGARYILTELKGRFPDDFEALKKVPGIGTYTAAAVASIAFGRAAAVLDGNVKRVLSRIVLIDTELSDSRTKARLEALAQEILDPDRPGDFNQALMELGATICLPKRPKCLLCPVRAYCRAQQELPDPSALPVKKARKAIPHYEIAVGLIWDDGYVFIDKRPEDGMLGGLWEFPGGKIENGESARMAVKREIKEELNLDVEVGDYFMEVQHAYSHFKITMHVFHCTYRGGEPSLAAATDWRWVRPEELRFFPFAAASHKIIRKLESEFSPQRRK